MLDKPGRAECVVSGSERNTRSYSYLGFFTSADEV
jgi:hypothetical protein